MATLMRRTEVMTLAPILSSFSRRLPTVALARQVCLRALLRKASTCEPLC